MGAPQEELATGERSTRNRVARSILDHGPSTVAELARRLGLTQAAVRRHLDALVADDVVEPREQRVYGARTRGRPAKVFALTDCGRDAFDQSYDKLATDALRWIASAAAAATRRVAAFARARIAEQAERLPRGDRGGRPRGARRGPGQGPDARTGTLLRRAAHRSASSSASTTARSRHVAEKFPQLCEAETEVFSQLLGTHVQRLATIAHGDGVCTTFIPKAHTPPRTAPQRLHRPTTSASASTAGRNPA